MNNTAPFLALAALCILPSAQADDWTKTWNVGAQPELRVEAGDASIDLEGADTNSIRAHLVTEGYKIGYDGVEVVEHQAGDHVDIRIKEPSGHFGNWGHHSIRLQIQAPRQLIGVVKTGDGSIRLKDVRGSLRVDTGDGSIEGANLGGSLDAHTGDGSMRLNGLFSDVRLRTGDGSIQLQALSGSSLHSDWELHSGDGSISVTLPKNLNANLQLRTGDGHIHTDLPLTVSDLHGQHEVRGKLNGGGPLLNIHTGDGSITVGAS
jgi:Putative adhesin